MEVDVFSTRSAQITEHKKKLNSFVFSLKQIKIRLKIWKTYEKYSR